MDKKAMYKLSYGLFVLTSGVDGKDSGCIINTAQQVTSDPNRISIAVNKANFTHDLVKESGRFNISTISEAASFDLFKHFGFQSGREVDKFSGYTECKRSANGLYYITAGTNSYISAAVEQEVDLGSHTLFIASVEDMEVLSDTASATYEYYQSSIKPKPARRPRPERRCGAVRSAVMFTRERNCPLIISVRCANIRPRILRK